jgi:transposase
MNITIIGIDLAKAVFQIHGVDERGKVAVRKQLNQNMQNLFSFRLFIPEILKYKMI